MTENGSPKIRDGLSVDVEEYFHATIFDGRISEHEWEERQGRSAPAVERLLERFDQWGVCATFFVLGWFAERNRPLIRRIHEAGHEVGCHGGRHELIHNLSEEQFREDVGAAKSLLEDMIGARVTGYRAPTFSITRKTLWAIPILEELGFEYDSSIFPIHHDRYGIPGFPADPVRLQTGGAEIIEVPMTTFPLGPVAFPVSGGGYLRLLPFPLIRQGFRSVRKRGGFINLYTHPWEIDSDQPRIPMPLLSRIRHYSGIGRVEERLGRLIGEGAFGPIREAIRSRELPLYEMESFDQD